MLFVVNPLLNFIFFYFITWLFPFQGISSTTPLLANSSKETPVLSPLVPVSSLGSSKGEDQKQKAVTKPEKVQAILKGIKQVWDAYQCSWLFAFGFLVCNSWYSFIKSMFGRPEQVYIERILNEMIPILSAKKYKWKLLTFNIPDMATSKEKYFNYLNSETDPTLFIQYNACDECI